MNTASIREISMRLVLVFISLGLCGAAAAQDYRKWGEDQLLEELERVADVTRKVNVEMRDGVHLSTDVYLPKDAPDAVPTVFWRTPYNFNTLSADETTSAGCRSGQSWLCLRYPERAWPVLFRRGVRNSRQSANGWL